MLSLRMTINIFIFGPESPKATIIAREIKKIEANVNIIGVSNKFVSRFIHSKYIDQVHQFQNKKVWFKRLSSKYQGDKNINYILPVTSTWGREIYRLLPILGNNVVLLQADVASYQQLDNKMLFKDFISGVGNAPMRLTHLKVQDGKFVAKPKVGSGSKGVIYLDASQPDDREKIINYCSSSEYIVEEFIEGVGVGIGGYAINGQVINSSSHIRLLEWPVSGGSSAYRGPLQSIELERIFHATVKSFNWNGFLMIEGKLTTDGLFYVLEANPRTWGGIHQFMRTTNFATQFCDSLFGRPVPKPIRRLSSNTFSSPLAYLSLLMTPRKSKFQSSIKFLRDTRKKADVNFYTDPRGWCAQFIND